MSIHGLSPVAEIDLSSFLAAHDDDTPLSTAQGSHSVAFQRWFHFKEAFSPRFVADTVARLPRRPKTCLDPFGGSGTTALTCQFLGIKPTTIEVNPFLADLIESKLTTYSLRDLLNQREELDAALEQAAPDLSTLYRDAPQTLCEPGKNNRWIFDEPVIYRVAQYVSALEKLTNPQAARLFRVLLGSTLIQLSNVVINGKGRRYRRNWALSRKTRSMVDEAFGSQFLAAVHDLSRFPRRAAKEFVLHRGDSRSLIQGCDEADLVLFSPPYPNSFDYTDIYNVELWALGYLKSKSDNLDLRTSTLSSHVQIKRIFEAAPVSETLSQAINALHERTDMLWDKSIPAMIGAYFADIARILDQSESILSPDGRIVMVVGDSRYAGIHVDVAKIIGEIAPRLGLCMERCTPIRSMRASAQQGGDHSLGEVNIRLKRI